MAPFFAIPMTPIPGFLRLGANDLNDKNGCIVIYRYLTGGLHDRL